MTDKKLTDNEIIKALESEIHLAEYVDSDYCSNVNLEIIKSALDLITRQQAEIERLKEIIEYKDICIEACEDIKSEAYKECIEKVRKLAVGMHPCSDELRVFDSDLDNLIKEMVGEDK